MLTISICAIPKGGFTMNRQIIAKAANVLGEKCFLIGLPKTTNYLVKTVQREHKIYCTCIIKF